MDTALSNRTASPSTTTPTRSGGLGYLPGLDGLRALAVGAVFLFHAEVLPGGFLGVDVFFVISGFLITGLALGEVETTGRFRLGAFWGRRARRLLPALYVLCAAVVVIAWLDGPAPRTLRSDVWSTLLYVANWQRISEGYDYFAIYVDPSLLEHAWSLAIEEQFYIFWPLVVLAAVAVARRIGRRLRTVVGVTAAALAVASCGWATWLAARTDTGLNRLYFGTDTRLGALALGCATACLLARGADTGRRRIGRRGTGTAVAGTVVLVVMMLTVDGGERWLYGPGLAMASLAALAVVVAAAGEGPVARVLGTTALVQVGRVSYGIYLWHWPVIVVLDHDRTGLDGVVLGALWVAVTAVLVLASWFLVERRAPTPIVRRPIRAIAYVGAALAIAVAASVVTDRDNPDLVGDDLVLPATPTAAPATAAGGTTAEAGPTTDDTSGPAGAAGAAPEDERHVTTDDAAGPTSPDAADPAEPADPADPAEPADPASAEAATASGDVVPDATSDDATAAGAAAWEPPPDRPLRLMVLGDSVPFSLRPDPDGPVAVDGLDVEVVNRAVIACPLITVGTTITDDGDVFPDPAVCTDDDRFGDEVETVDPDAILLWFGWPGIGGSREIDGEVVHPCDPLFDRTWGQSLATLADRMSEHADVVVATVAPASEIPAGQEGRTECLNREVAGSGLPTFDYAAWMCPRGDCAAAADLRWDGIHFVDDADLRAAVWPEVVGQVVAALRAGPSG